MSLIYFVDIDWRPAIFYFKANKLYFSWTGYGGKEILVNEDMCEEILRKAEVARVELLKKMGQHNE